VDLAFLIGVGNYPDHQVPVGNDLALLRGALLSRGYRASDVHVFDNSHTTRAALLDMFDSIRRSYASEALDSCYLHISASGVISEDPLEGGILPSDGRSDDFTSGVSFGVLNDCLPLRFGAKSVVTLDT
jgi:hypothetical protein